MIASANLLKIQKMYSSCIKELTKSQLLIPLTSVKNRGILDEDQTEYPVPTLEQVIHLFEQNGDLVMKKHIQGFSRLMLIPMAIPLKQLIELTHDALIRHNDRGELFHQRKTSSEPLAAVKLNKDKLVWEWETLRDVIEKDKIVYFPRNYNSQHYGLRKKQMLRNPQFCAVPGWCVCMVEETPYMPKQGKAEILGGRKQLEIGYTPNEYREILQGEAYEGETGMTLEDFLVLFLLHLTRTNEICYDMEDANAVWCLGNYLEIPYARLIPTGRWLSSLGRLRLDTHRTNNKQCTKNWGANTLVRLKGKL